jgi:hypothetical protein
MVFNNGTERKRKPTEIPETVSSDDGRNPEEESNRARRVSKNALTSNATYLPVETSVANEKATTAGSSSSPVGRSKLIDGACVPDPVYVSLNLIARLYRYYVNISSISY